MKKNYLLLTLLLLGITFSSIAKKVDMSTARLVGKNFYYEQINSKTAVPYESISITGQYAESYNNEIVYYVFSINDKGFIIVSADDAVTPVIGYSFRNIFDPDNQPENFKGWMEHYMQQIEYVRQNNISADLDITTTWNRLLTENPKDLTISKGVLDLEPLLINMEWDQTFPYNAMCPADPAGPDGHALVGCIATAMSQIMTYWRYPATGQGYHCIFPTSSYGPQCADFANTTYDWDGITTGNDKECDPAALISYQAAVAVDMDFGPSASGSFMPKVPPAFINYFKYDNTVQAKNRYSNLTDWKNLIYDELNAGQPVMYNGSSTASGGHAWVCDGYQGADNFHMNWGWGGYANGYFTLNALNPAGENFNSNQGAVVYIKPDPDYYPVFCSGQKTLTTYDFGMIEDGSGPNQNYQGSANCSWLINIQDSIKNVTLSFDRFELNATDFVKIYDGADATAPLLATYTGTSLPANVTSTGSKMFVTFTSASGSSAKGFLASYNTSLYNFCTNNTVLTATEGTFQDGSSSFLYRNGQSCRWTITPPNAKTITLAFNNFNTEADKDLMKIFDTQNITVPIAIISGEYSTPPASVSTTSGGMMVMFITNKTIRGQGWNVSYTITVGTEDSRNFENLNVYPNPTEGKINLSFNLNDIQQVKIEVISLTGNVVYAENFDNFKGLFEKQLDLTGLSKGVYMLKLTSDKGIINKKIIIR